MEKLRRSPCASANGLTAHRRRFPPQHLLRPEAAGHVLTAREPLGCRVRSPLRLIDAEQAPGANGGAGIQGLVEKCLIRPWACASFRALQRPK
jgi:hypothetical protein